MFFYHKEKEIAQARLKNVIKAYDNKSKELEKAVNALYQTRVDVARGVIRHCEEYINSFANSPKDFRVAIKQLKIKLKEITYEDRELAQKDYNTVKASGVAGAGIAAGAGVATLAPGAMMAFATTFGTASTGTAISALSGAAASNAALAWLGGGALAAGGGGMAAGSAFLALAGPIGWGIGGVALVGSGIFLSNSNKETTIKARQRAKKIKSVLDRMKCTNTEINNLEKEALSISMFIFNELKYFKLNAPKDYLKFDDSQQKRLLILINNISSLRASIGKTVPLNF